VVSFTANAVNEISNTTPANSSRWFPHGVLIVATYLELYAERTDSDFLNRISVAVMIKAEELIDKSPPSSDEAKWAAAAIRDPDSKAGELAHYILASRKGQSQPDIIGGLTDVNIKNKVSDAVDKLIAAGVV